MNLFLEKYYTQGFKKENCCIIAYSHSDRSIAI